MAEAGGDGGAGRVRDGEATLVRDGGGAPVRAWSDCEACRPGLVSQPWNTLSSLAYVAAGAAVATESRRHPAGARPGSGPLAWGLVAVGAGSIAYHGPGGTLGKWAHDASLVALSGLVAVADAHAHRGATPGPGAVAAVWALAAAAANPRTSPFAQAAGAAVATAAELARPSRGRRDLAAAALLGVGLVLQVEGRTGGPLCRPGSRFQPHAAWHALSAAALYLTTRPGRGAPATVRARARP